MEFPLESILHLVHLLDRILDKGKIIKVKMICNLPVSFCSHDDFPDWERLFYIFIEIELVEELEETFKLVSFPNLDIIF
jgi:hypothetical protein